MVVARADEEGWVHRGFLVSVWTVKSVKTGGGPDTALSVWVVEQYEITVETLAFQSGLCLRYPHMIDSQRAAGRESAVLCGAVTFTDPAVVEAHRSGTGG